MSFTLQDAISKNTLLSCKGFLPNFLSPTKKINFESILNADNKKFLPKVEGNSKGYLNYQNLTILYNSARKLPFFSIYGVDASQKAHQVKRTTFRIDPRLDANIQLNKAFYNLRMDITEFEIGHMAANHEMAWGSEAQIQSYQTFHFPNSVPQAEKLNSGMWRDLEAYIVKEASAILINQKVVVITGPVLQHNDPVYKFDSSFQIPLLFYKLVIFATTKGYFSTAFVMSHEQKMIEEDMFLGSSSIKRGSRTLKESMAFENYSYRDVFQINVNTLEKLSGLKFSWTGVKHLAIPDDANKIVKIKTITKSSNKPTRGIQSGKVLGETTLILP